MYVPRSLPRAPGGGPTYALTSLKMANNMISSIDLIIKFFIFFPILVGLIIILITAF